MILVTAATGNVGSYLVRELREQGLPVRAFVRDPTKAAEQLGDGVDLTVGDFSEPESVRHALEGVDKLFLACPNHPRQVDYETGVVDAAGAAGVERIVKLSTLAAQVGSPVDFWDWQGRIEQHLRRSDVPAVIVAASTFMSNLFSVAESVRREGRIYAPADGASISWVDPRDVAAVAAVALTVGGQEGKTHVVTGPEALTYAEVAQTLSQVTGRSVEFVNVPPEAAYASMVAAGMPNWVARNLVRMLEFFQKGAAEQTTDTVRKLTGREPQTFTEFAQDHATLFRA